MAGQSSDEAEDRKRKAESAAKVVLAKHPAVCAGSVRPMVVKDDAPRPQVVDVGVQNIGRGLRR